MSSRRRKRKKEKQSQLDQESSSSTLFNSKTEPVAKSQPPASKASPAQEAPGTHGEKEATKPATAPNVPGSSAQIQDSDLELELDNSFDDDFTPNIESTVSLPSGDNKKEMRPLRRESSSPAVEQTNETEEKEERTKKSDSASQPPKRQPMREVAQAKTLVQDDLGHLEDDFDDSTDATPPSEEEAKAKSTDPADALSESSSEGVATLPLSVSIRKLATKALSSLSLLEQAALGLLVLTLLIAGIWSTSILFSQIPNTIIASKLKYPLKGDSLVVESLESYWRSPIREGANIDEGVSETIEIIPEVKLTLHPQSSAKALRFLFRDEEGRFVGDSSTVRISGAKFLPSDSVTASTNGATTIVRSTTGFQHEGELISYLADDTFQWEIVILESKDGEEFTEFMAIPISANRNDKS